MRIDIATLFPEMCNTFVTESIIGRAVKNRYIEIYCHNIRDFTFDKRRRVDDKAFGGGTGMVIRSEPVYNCIDYLKSFSENPRIIYMSPQGKTLTQQLVKELANEEQLILLCGHYEGIDQRVLTKLAIEEISVGDFVVTGGEMPALMLTDAVARLQKGVLPNAEAYTLESHWDGLLEHPLYTHPEVWKNMSVPSVLVSGHHANIEKWQTEQNLAVTKLKRPDLLHLYEEEQRS